MPGRTSGGDPSEGNAEAEARSAGCTVDMGTANRRPLSGDLDALNRRAGLANLAAGPAPVGEDAIAITAHVAVAYGTVWACRLGGWDSEFVSLVAPSVIERFSTMPPVAIEMM